MKFTSLAVAALFLANTSAILLQKQAKDDCGGKWCNKGLAYDLDEATLRKAVADNNAIAAHASSTQHASDTAAANAAAGEAKAAASAGLAKATETYTDRDGYTAAR